jgi:hypothetical protein
MDRSRDTDIDRPDLPSSADQPTVGVYLPDWAAPSFGRLELAVLGAVRDVAYNAPDGKCSLTVKEIARRAGVIPRTAARAIGMAIAVGVIEREERSLLNRHIHYKVN